MMKNLINLICLTICFLAFGQNQRVKDDPNARVEFEVRKLVNPQTGRIPSNIRSRELAFAKKSQQKVRVSTLDETSVWDRRGPFNVGGRTRALAVDSRDENIILAGGVSGGMWRSDDLGSTWTKVLDVSELQSVTCIAQDPTTPDTWYYGTGESSGNSASGRGAFFIGDGIYKSTNNGLTWNVLPSTTNESPEIFELGSLGAFNIVNEIVIDPTNGDVYAATFFGIFRSTNGGTEFTQVLENPNQQWSDVTVTSDGIFYASLEGDGVYRSTDGTSWSDITDPDFANNLANGDRIELALAPSAQDTLYVLAENGASHSLWMYDHNEGGTAEWTDRTENIPTGAPFGEPVGDFDSQGGYDLIVTVKPDDPDFVLIGGTNLYRSTDGFATSINTEDWIGGYSPVNNVSSYTNQHPDQHSFVFLSGNRAISGTDGGLHLTEDITDRDANGSGETVDWTNLNNGYFTSQVYAISIGPGDQIISGFQDNGNWLVNSTVESEDWEDQLVNFFGGDGTYNAISSNAVRRYISTQNARIFRLTYSNAADLSFNGFQQIDPDPDEIGYDGIFVTPFYLDPADDDLFYLAGDFDFLINTQVSTSSRTAGWKKVDLPGNSGFVSEIGTTIDDVVYVGTSVGELYKIENPKNPGAVVTDITAGVFPSGYISSIGVNEFNPNELLVVFSNYSVQSIFYSNDGGVSFQNISGNLEENTDGSGSGPSVRAARIVGNSFEYIVGTSTGLYSTRTIDGINTTWVQEGASNIGNVVINHIVTRSDGLIVAGTHGNGIYSSRAFPTLDLSVATINPKSQAFETPTDVIATVLNGGSTTIETFDISLTVDGVEIVSETVNATILGFTEYDHTFSQQVDLTALGQYDIEVSITLVGDEIESNNSKSVTIESQAAPTDLTLSNASIEEDQEVGTLIGTFSTEDLDDDVHTYAFVDEAENDNSDFSIVENELRSSSVFDFEVKTSFSIIVETADGDNNTFVKSFTIDVVDTEEPLSTEDLDKLGIVVYPNPFGSTVYLEMINEYVGDIQIVVSDIEGRSVLLSESYNKTNTQTKSLLSLETLSSGTYIITVTMGNEVFAGRLIKN